MRHTTTITLFLLTCVAVVQAGVRADLSGDAVVDFQTTMDMPFMTVGNPGNTADDLGFGGVDYAYNIGKFEVTAGQYTEFLNAVAGTDTYNLWNSAMGSYSIACQIQRSGVSGSFSYSISSERQDRPVNYVTWGSAVRFVNWLTNGQPTGVQGATTTEDGSYAIYGATAYEDLANVVRRADARYVIPTEDEWYKAAYYDGSADIYYDLPTGSESVPSNDLIDPDPGNNTNFYDEAGYTVGVPYFTTEVGEFENSSSPYGTFDQGGNVWDVRRQLKWQF